MDAIGEGPGPLCTWDPQTPGGPLRLSLLGGHDSNIGPTPTTIESDNKGSRGVSHATTTQ